MADIHVRQASDNHIQLLFHIAVPAANNDAGVSYRTALAQTGGDTALPDATDPDNPAGWEIGSVEKAAIAAGELLEHSISMHVLPSEYGNPATLLAKARALYAAEANQALSQHQHALRFWGGAYAKE
jgi:hypothetical protein